MFSTPPGGLAPHPLSRSSRTLLAAIIAASALASGCKTLPPTAARELCVVRHAEAYKNVPALSAGMTPEQLDRLTPAGEAQAKALRDRLSGLALAWTSPAGRAQATAALASDVAAVERAELRSLDGDVAWSKRLADWAQGTDPRAPGGESLEDGAVRARALLEELRQALPAGGRAAVFTHGDLAALLLGELQGTPLLQRPTAHELAASEARCVPLDPG